MTVTYDAVGFSAIGYTVTNRTTAAFTIDNGGAGNVAAMLQLCGTLTGSSSFSGWVGDDTYPASAISGADGQVQSGTNRAMCWGRTAPPTGSQTGYMTWTTAAGAAILGCITATGVDQSTSFNNGNTGNAGYDAGVNLQITGNAGDLTATCCSASATAPATNQMSRWNGGSNRGDTGGSGTTTHQWTGTHFIVVSGANFVAAGGGATTVSTGRLVGTDLPLAGAIPFHGVVF